MPYLPSFGIPLIADDYPNIAQALSYGAPEGARALLADAQFRLRATSYWTMYALRQAAGASPWAYHAASVALHIAATWLLWLLASAWPRMRDAAFWAALFFAVYEGHQEAVMWFSAINELLMFCFGMAALWCWITTQPGGEKAWTREAAGVVFFALALLSKESAIVWLPLFAVVVDPTEWRKRLPRLAPHVALAALALASIAQSRANSFRFSDGSFSLHAPFWLTWPHSMARLLWVFGWLALIALRFTGAPRWWRGIPAALAWMGIALLPYSFLTYSTRIPSRQVYLASAGLALLVGLAMARLAAHRLGPAVLAAVIVVNTATLWTKKRRQFVERAAPTEALLNAARRTPGAIWVQCFPLPPFVAGEALRLTLGRPASDLVWDESVARQRGAAPFCYRDPAISPVDR